MTGCWSTWTMSQVCTWFVSRSRIRAGVGPSPYSTTMRISRGIPSTTGYGRSMMAVAIYRRVIGSIRLMIWWCSTRVSALFWKSVDFGGGVFLWGVRDTDIDSESCLEIVFCRFWYIKIWHINRPILKFFFWNLLI